MMDEMGIDTGIDIDKILVLGSLLERTVGRRLRSNSVMNGRVPKEPKPEYQRAGLRELKAKLGEESDQKLPI